MIEFRYRQKIYKATCNCDQKGDYATLKREHGDRAVGILTVGCSKCRHYHCIILSNNNLKRLKSNYGAYIYLTSFRNLIIKHPVLGKIKIPKGRADYQIRVP